MRYSNRKTYTDRKLELLKSCVEMLLSTGETDDDVIIRRAFAITNGILDRSREEWERFSEENPRQHHSGSAWPQRDEPEL